MAGTSTWIISALALSLLAACGGGGGSDKAADPGTTAAAPAAAPAPNRATPADNQPDPLYASQWHLKNTGQAAAAGPAATAGQDLNVEPVWNSCNDNGTCKGEGIAIAVVDRGVEIAHPDLQPNLSSSLAGRVYSLNGAPANGDPTPVQTDRENAHGTAVAGIVAARDNNGLGGRGVAPRATFTGYALLQASTNSNEADAMAFQAKDVAVSNNSWGPADGNGQLSDANSLWRDAIEFGLASGRNGLGTIYVWAAGNGYNSGFKERSTYDGYASYRGVIAVGALNAQGRRSSYSEPGANVWVSAPGGEPCAGGLAILTTDLSGAKGYNAGAGAPELDDADYTRCMNGTSAAVPSVSGVMALMLQANPALGWRDARARQIRRTLPGKPMAPAAASATPMVLALSMPRPRWMPPAAGSICRRKRSSVRRLRQSTCRCRTMRRPGSRAR
jgi:proprotein convertase subtilisin/kexin type 2